MDILTAVSTVGFPIGMCFWFMFIHKKTMDRNTLVLEQLKELIREKLK